MTEKGRRSGLETTPPPSGPEGNGPAVKVGGGEGRLKNWQRKDMTKKVEPTEVDRGASNIKGRERGAN